MFKNGGVIFYVWELCIFFFSCHIALLIFLKQLEFLFLLWAQQAYFDYFVMEMVLRKYIVLWFYGFSAYGFLWSCSKRNLIKLTSSLHCLLHKPLIQQMCGSLTFQWIKHYTDSLTKPTFTVVSWINRSLG